MWEKKEKSYFSDHTRIKKAIFTVACLVAKFLNRNVVKR